MTADPGLSAADMAAIKVIAEGQIATNRALAELTHTIAARDGVALDAPVQPQPGRPRQKRVRRFRLSRDENGELVGEEIDPVGAAMRPPVADTGPATEIVPEGDFADVFGGTEAIDDRDGDSIGEDENLMYQRILIAFVVALVVMFVAYVLLMGKP